MSELKNNAVVTEAAAATEEATVSAAEWKARTAEKLTALENACAVYQRLLGEDNLAAGKTAYADCELACTEYNKAHLSAIYAELLEQENPMLAAVKYGSVTVKVVKVSEDKDTGTMTVSAEDKTDKSHVLDLISFNRVAGRNLFVNPRWIEAADELAEVLCRQTTAEFKLSAEDEKALSEAFSLARSEGRIMLKSVKEFSKNKFVDDLQQIFDAIVMVPGGANGKNKVKATTRELAYLMNIKAGKGKRGALDTRVMGKADFRQAIMCFMYALATDQPYTFTFRK